MFVVLGVLGVLGGSLTMAAVSAYLSGASFVLQDGFGLDEREFGLVLGVGAIGLISFSQVNVTLLLGTPPRRSSAPP